MSKTQSIILQNAEQLRALRDALELAWREQPRSSNHLAAAEAFHASYDTLAFPGGLDAGLVALRNRDPATIEIAIRFLEADPVFPHSGNIKVKLIRRLKQATLSANQLRRLRIVVLRSLASWRMPLVIVTLAPKVETPSFVRDIHAALDSSNERVRIRAERILQVLKSAGR